MKIILLNSTLFSNHHGCELVSKQIKNLFKKYKYKLVEECYNHENLDEIISKLKKYFFDLAVVNGEGTLHDCQSQSLTLLKSVEFIYKKKKSPIILFNASIQKMDSEIKKFKYFKKIYVRDSDSYNYLKKFEINSEYSSDILITYKHRLNIKKKYNTTIGDSADFNLTKKLLFFSKKNNFKFIPIRTVTRIGIWKKNTSLKYKLANTFYFFQFFLIVFFRRKIKKRNFHLLYKYYINNHNNYLKRITESCLIVTARYHQIILCLVTYTPFLALDSITVKNTSLLKDVGLLSRKIYYKNLTKNKLRNLSFSNIEKKKIQIYKKNSIRKIDEMFKNFKHIHKN